MIPHPAAHLVPSQPISTPQTQDAYGVAHLRECLAEDPRTNEFTGGYLTPLQIVSMLDAGIWRGGAHSRGR